MVLTVKGVGKPQLSVNNWSLPIDITEGVSSNWRAYGIPLCDKYQNLHIFWVDNVASGAAIYYRNDINNYWSMPTDIMQFSYPNIHNLNGAISNKDDFIHLIWVDTGGLGNLYYSGAPLYNAMDPRSWSQPRLIEENVHDGAIQVDRDGFVHIVYASADSTARNFKVIHIVSNDNGISWSNPSLILTKTFPDPSYIRSEMSIDDEGRIHVGLTLRSQEYGIISEVGYVRSLDNGQSWAAYKVIDDTSSTFQGVEWIAPYAFGKNEVHLTWHEPNRMHQYSLDGGDTWSKPDVIMPLGGAFGGPNQLVKDSSGIIHAVTAVSNGVYSIKWEGGRWGQPEQIDNRDIDPHGQHIVVCQGNQLSVIYYDRTGEETVWYATQTLNAPHIDRKPIIIPTFTPLPELSLTSTKEFSSSVVITQTAKIIPGDSNGEFSSSKFPLNSLTLITIGILPVVIIILCVILFRAIRIH